MVGSSCHIYENQNEISLVHSICFCNLGQQIRPRNRQFTPCCHHDIRSSLKYWSNMMNYGILWHFHPSMLCPVFPHVVVCLATLFQYRYRTRLVPKYYSDVTQSRLDVIQEGQDEYPQLKTAGQFGPKKGDIEWVHYNEYIEYHIGDIEYDILVTLCTM